jgi:glutamate carboxypeptidase
LHFEGRAAHAGLDPERGINALLLAARLAAESQGWADPARGTTVVPTTLSAGTTANTVPAGAELTIDARSWEASEQQRIDALVRSWDASPGTMRIVEGGINRSAMEPAMSMGLFEQAQAAAAELGLGGLRNAAVGGASDGNFTAAAGIPTLDGLGAVGDGAHADHEWASVAELSERTALVAELLRRLTG